MTDHSRHDIYGTKRDDREPVPEVEEGPHEWTKQVKRFRVNTYLFVIALLAFVALLSFVLIRQYLNSSELHNERVRRAAATAKSLPARPLDFTESPEEMFLADELTDLELLPLPKNGDLPLAAKWVKQAAHHLILAEKAEEGHLDEVALEEYQQALWIFPDLRGIHRRIGLTQIRQKNYAGAAASFEKAMIENTLSYGIANNLGVAYLQLNEDRRALTAFQEAIKLKPDYAPALFNLATLYLRTGNPERAAEHLKTYITMSPGDIKGAYSYAYALIQLKDWQEAAAMLQQLARLNPESPPIYFRLAQALMNLDQEYEAVQALTRGTALVDPGDALSRIQRKEFEGLRGNPRFEQLVKNLGG